MKTSKVQNGLIWFGAGVSLAEILAGTSFASLGLGKGVLAVLLGHVIGGLLFFLAGLIGARTKRSSMETVQLSFGKKGAIFFAILNVLQLLGWTSIMVYDGAEAASGIYAIDYRIFAIAIGALIFLWIFFGVKDLKWLNRVAMGALLALSVWLLVALIWKGKGAGSAGESISFGAAVELSVAMPLSWLPLISDYTREAEEPFGATLVSAITYGLCSSFMYLIGMIAALYTGESQIAQILLRGGFGILALLIVVLSTTTTTFLDAWSAGISSESISSKLKGKPVALVTCVLGVLLACLFQITDITDFLYLIGSVFAPMAALLITDYFILRRNSGSFNFDVVNIILWVLGFVFYRWMMTVELPVGSTFPCMVVIGVVAALVRVLMKWIAVRFFKSRVLKIFS